MKVQIVFTEPSSNFGKFVRFMIGGKFTHAHFLFVSNRLTRTYEAFPPRIRLANENLYPDATDVIELPFNHREAEALLDVAIEDSQKCIYGADDAFRIFVRSRISKSLARWLGRKWQDSHTETCTTMVVKRLRHIWPDFGGEDAMEFTPDEVYQALLEKLKE